MIGFTGRTERLCRLLVLLLGILVPMAMNIFLAPDASQFPYSWENRLRSLEDVDNETILPSILSDGRKTLNKYSRNLDFEFTRANADNSELNPMFVLETLEFQKDRKKNIHAIVTAMVALAVPLMTFVYAFLFLRKRPGPGPDLPKKKRLSRKERLLRDLANCRVRLPKARDANDTSSGITTNQDSHRECPICLCGFSEGEVVIASKDCHCSISRRVDSNDRKAGSTSTTSSRIATTMDAANAGHKYHRTYFHEECISKWLSQSKINPRKLCPCCRQPFFLSSTSSKRRKGDEEEEN